GPHRRAPTLHLPLHLHLIALVGLLRAASRAPSIGMTLREIRFPWPPSGQCQRASIVRRSGTVRVHLPCRSGGPGIPRRRYQRSFYRLLDAEGSPRVLLEVRNDLDQRRDDEEAGSE